eukprot:jgi/Mesvir1/6010/Mv00757-RA.1
MASTPAQAIGCSNPAYFVGRTEILSWIKNTVGLNLSKVEQAASGAVACLLIDAVHPGLIPLHRVNLSAISESDMVNNYKLLQAGFDKLKIIKHIEVNKLVKARPLDNLEFLQWLKQYCDSVTSPEGVNTDRIQERLDACKGNPATLGGVATGGGGGAAPPKKAGGAAALVKPAAPSAASRAKSGRPGAGHHADGAAEKHEKKTDGAAKHGHADDHASKEEITELKLTVDSLEKERDFYFAKLRDVEILCQMPELQDLKVVQAVQKILYATEDTPEIMEEARAMIKTSAEAPAAEEEAPVEVESG